MRIELAMCLCFLVAGCGGANVGSLFGDGGDASATATASGDAGGPGGNQQQIPCGISSCAIPAEACCLYETNPPTSVCVQGSSCPIVDGGVDGGGRGMGTALKCSGAANCSPSTLCCVFEGPNKQVMSDCLASCPSNGAQLCDPSAPVPGCAPNAPCSSANISDWGLPKGYATCGGVGN